MSQVSIPLVSLTTVDKSKRSCFLGSDKESQKESRKYPHLSKNTDNLHYFMSYFSYKSAESRHKFFLGLLFLSKAGAKQSNDDIENPQAKYQNSCDPCDGSIVISTGKVVEDSRSHAG